MAEPGASAQSADGSYIAQADRGATAIVTVYQAAAPAAIAPEQLAAATKRLQELPLDVVPAPAALPRARTCRLRAMPSS